MAVYFFSATKRAHDQITSLFDFIGPTSVAIWNLRWQVDGFFQALGNPTENQLHSRFIEGSEITGANLRRACKEHSWDYQKEKFAEIVLVNVFAIHESWLDSLLGDLGILTKGRLKAFQYPQSLTSAGADILSEINALTANESQFLKSNFYSTLCGSRHYSLPQLNALMLCYRFFKELRNCLVHKGGITDQKLFNTLTQFTPVATPSNLSVNEVPKFSPVVLGSPIKLSLRGVIGFSSIIIKIITTIDAELSRIKIAEPAFKRKWISTHKTSPILSAEKNRRHASVSFNATRAGFPRPSDLAELSKWLKQEALVKF